MKPNLANVTICAVDCVTPHLATQAIKKSMELCNFGDAIIISDINYKPTKNEEIRKVTINKLQSRDEYSRFIIKELQKYITTEYVLIAQWDGYVVDSSSWTDDFFMYDYIGAKWYWHQDGMNIGNGGFSLRSKKLLTILSDPAFECIPTIPEDDLICRTYRRTLEKDFGIRFAAEDIADVFSYERSLPRKPTFGFHGLFNIWRHLEDRDVIKIAGELDSRTIRSREFYELTIQYLILRKFNPFFELLKILKKHEEIENIRYQIYNLTGDDKFSEYVVSLQR